MAILIKPQSFDSENDTVYVYDLKRKRETKARVKTVEEDGQVLYAGEILSTLGWSILMRQESGNQYFFLIETDKLENGVKFPEGLLAGMAMGCS